jgi:hypothetical protein
MPFFIAAFICIVLTDVKDEQTLNNYANETVCTSAYDEFCISSNTGKLREWTDGPD